jgi:membrane fusion protein (multidrug efflux system)
MSRTRITMIAVAALLVMVFAIAKASKDKRESGAETAYTSVIPVSGFVLETKPFESFIEESGTLQGRRESVLAAEVGGQVEQVYVEIGDVVKSGQSLLKLDDELLELDAERAKIAYDKAKLDFERVEAIYKDKGFSDSDLENARLGLKAAEVQYRAAKKMFEDATLRAPYSGTITAKMTEIGQMIEKGMPAFQIVDISQLKLPIAISENEIHNIHVGAAAKVFVESLKDTLDAEVTAVGARSTQGARTFPVELTMQGNEDVRAGMFARVSIFAGVDSNSLVIPRAATLPDVGRTVVFVAKGAKAEKKTVRILGTEQDQLAINGLMAGDTVIVTGNQLLSQGSQINLTLE